MGGQRLSLSAASLQQVPREKREWTGFGNEMATQRSAAILPTMTLLK
jgi:hypothetical protein